MVDELPSGMEHVVLRMHSRETQNAQQQVQHVLAGLHLGTLQHPGEEHATCEPSTGGTGTHGSVHVQLEQQEMQHASTGTADGSAAQQQAVTEDAVAAQEQQEHAAERAAAAEERANYRWRQRVGGRPAAAIGTDELAWRLHKVRIKSPPTASDFTSATLLREADPEQQAAQSRAEQARQAANAIALPGAAPSTGPHPPDALAPLASFGRDMYRSGRYGRRYSDELYAGAGMAWVGAGGEVGEVARAHEAAVLESAGLRVLAIWSHQAREMAALIIQTFVRGRLARKQAEALRHKAAQEAGLEWGPLGSLDDEDLEAYMGTSRAAVSVEGAPAVEQAPQQAAVWSGQRSVASAEEGASCAGRAEVDEETENAASASTQGASSAPTPSQRMRAVRRALRQQARDVLLAVQAQQHYSRVRGRLQPQHALPTTASCAPHDPSVQAPSSAQPLPDTSAQPVPRMSRLPSAAPGSSGSSGSDPLATGPAPRVDHDLWQAARDLGLDPIRVRGAGAACA